MSRVTPSDIAFARHEHGAHVEHSIRAVLEVVPGSNPIRGDFLEAGGAAEPFVGWLALMSILERVVSASAPPDRVGEAEP